MRHFLTFLHDGPTPDCHIEPFVIEADLSPQGFYLGSPMICAHCGMEARIVSRGSIKE